MFSLRDFLFILCLSLRVLSAPLPGVLSADKEFLQINKEFSRKIIRDAERLINDLCRNEGWCEKSQLTFFQLQDVPLDQCQAGSFRQEGCFSQLSNGLMELQRRVMAMPGHLPKENLQRLEKDISDLFVNIQEEMEAQGITAQNSPSQTSLPTSTSTFHQKATMFLILSDLANFMRTLHSLLA
uniref:Colony stimulating factor 3 n=1 Tax=Xenopus laevis TaxID=8355 RepID=A0A679AQ73_XENLA|nr:colony stimulating factor 3 [Xenopus laevis]